MSVAGHHGLLLLQSGLGIRKALEELLGNPKGSLTGVYKGYYKAIIRI